MLRATPNEQLPLTTLVTDDNASLTGEVRVYDPSGTLTATVPLVYTDGLYTGVWTPTAEGVFTAVYSFFYDAGKTTPANTEYPKRAERIEVTYEKTNILRILGLLHENAVLDQMTHDSDGNMLTGRLRVYNNKGNADLAGAAGLRYQYSIEATFNEIGRAHV